MDGKIDIDEEHRDERLLGWVEIELSDATNIKVGNHLRVTSNKFQNPGRRCSHVVIQKIENEIVYVNSYKQKTYKDWPLKPNCPYKQQKYYMRPKTERKEEGMCVRCGTAKVQPPYYKCIFCKNQTLYDDNGNYHYHNGSRENDDINETNKHDDLRNVLKG